MAKLDDLLDEENELYELLTEKLSAITIENLVRFKRTMIEALESLSKVRFGLALMLEIYALTDNAKEVEYCDESGTSV